MIVEKNYSSTTKYVNQNFIFRMLCFKTFIVKLYSQLVTTVLL